MLQFLIIRNYSRGIISYLRINCNPTRPVRVFIHNPTVCLETIEQFVNRFQNTD